MVTCRTCNGEGASSQISTLTGFAITKAHINVQELDPHPKRLLSKIGVEKLAAAKHIDVTTIEPPRAEEDKSAWYEDAPTHDTSGVYYMAAIPWAIGEIIINKTPYEIGFVGNKGAVVDTKYFMDDVLKKPRNLLKQAARGDGFVAGLLKEACEYRVSRETLEAVVQGHKKRAMQSLMKTHGLGFSKPAVKDFVLNAFQALKRVTRRPRYIGLGIGLSIAAALFYTWFGMDIRSATDAQSDKARYIVDFIILIIGSVISFAGVKTAGFMALKSVMADIGLPIKQIPAAGTAGMYAVLGSLILWGGLFWFSAL